MPFLLCLLLFSDKGLENRFDSLPEILVTSGSISVSKKEVKACVLAQNSAPVTNLTKSEFASYVKKIANYRLDKKLLLKFAKEDDFSLEQIKKTKMKTIFNGFLGELDASRPIAQTIYQEDQLLDLWLRKKYYPSYGDMELEAMVFYEENITKFKQDTSYKLCQLSILGDEVFAQKVLALCKQGMPFTEVAKRLKDKVKFKQEARWVSKKDLPVSVGNTLTKKGAISKLINQDKTFVLLKVIEFQKNRTQSLEEAQTKVIKFLKAKKASEAMRKRQKKYYLENPREFSI